MSVNTKVNGQLVRSAGLYNTSVPIQSGDIYSLEERQVGVYTDGKPLYQKTLYIASLPSSKSTGTYSLNVSNAENCWVVDANSGTGNLNMIRVAEANVNDMQSASIYARCGVVDGDVKVYVEVGRDRSSMSAYVTVRYTKTTDVAGSGEYVPSGDKAVHYDDTEQVIGTWFGETLYRRTFDLGSDVTIPNNTWYASGVTITNLDKITNTFGVYSGGTFYPLMAYHTSGAINLLACRDGSTASVRYLTLEYTKTS